MGGLAGTVGSMVGIGGGAAAKGMNWAPGEVPLAMPVSEEQAKSAYDQSQAGIANQASFLSALQAQNGIQNQSSVFNQMQGVANGNGPNPAQAMLAQSTGANVANQAALMAGQRGAGANVGLMARQAGQQGSAAQQQAAGQAATLQANQSLGALSQLGGIAGQQVGQQAAATGALTGAQQSEQQMLLNQLNAQNNSSIAQQQGVNNANQAQAAQGAKAQSGLIQGAAMMMARGGPVYAAGGWSQVGTPEQVQSAPQDMSRQPMQYAANDQAPQAINQQYVPQQPNSAPGAPPAPPSPLRKSIQTATGQAASEQDKNKEQDPFNSSGQAVGQDVGKGLSGLGSSIKGLFGSSTPSASPQAGDMSASSMDMSGISGGGAAGSAFMAKGGKVPAMVSPGERYLSPKEVEKVAKGEKAPEKAGEKIKGKAKVKGDSLKNDTVPKTLEEGGIVLPKSVMEAKHPHWEAHKFVSAILAKKQGLKSRG